MIRKYLPPVLCVGLLAALMAGLMHMAGTPKGPLPTEMNTEDTATAAPLDLSITADSQGRPVFSFSLEDFIANFNQLSQRDLQEDLLPQAHLWNQSASLSQAEEPVGDCFSASPDQEVWFLPTISVYTRTGDPALSKLSVELDEHSDSPEKHDLFRDMCLYTLALFFPELDEDARTGLYQALEEQASTQLYEGIYHDEILPHILYYKGCIGVFPFFALGEYERFTFLPVTEDQLDAWASQGVQLVDLDQWTP